MPSARLTRSLIVVLTLAACRTSAAPPRGPTLGSGPDRGTCPPTRGAPSALLRQTDSRASDSAPAPALAPAPARLHVRVESGITLGEAIEGVRVQLRRDTVVRIAPWTASSGWTTLDTVPAGRYVLEARRIGFIGGAWSVEVRAGAVDTVELRLQGRNECPHY